MYKNKLILISIKIAKEIDLDEIDIFKWIIITNKRWFITDRFNIYLTNIYNNIMYLYNILLIF
jgi:hypothetical protein